MTETSKWNFLTFGLTKSNSIRILFQSTLRMHTRKPHEGNDVRLVSLVEGGSEGKWRELKNGKGELRGRKGELRGSCNTLSEGI